MKLFYLFTILSLLTFGCAHKKCDKSADNCSKDAKSCCKDGKCTSADKSCCKDGKCANAATTDKCTHKDAACCKEGKCVDHKKCTGHDCPSTAPVPATTTPAKKT